MQENVDPQTEAVRLFDRALGELSSPSRNLVLILRTCSHAYRLVGWGQHLQWCQSELHGYGPSDELPWYRKSVQGTLTWGTDDMRGAVSAAVRPYLRDSGSMMSRLNHRIVQALGRCNRSAQDFAVYVLADPRFSVHSGPESHRTGIPWNLAAEIDLA